MNANTVLDCRLHGQTLRLMPEPAADPLVAAQPGLRFPGLALIERAASRLPESPCVVDAGAGAGFASVFFARVSGASTIAIEPDRTRVERLRRHVVINELGDRIEVHALALGEAAGRDERFGVRTGTLDELVGERHVDLLRVAAPGAQARALRGAGALLARCKPLLIVEAAGEDLAAVEAQLRPLGYVKRDVDPGIASWLFEHDNGQARVLERLSPAVLARLPRTTQIVAGMATVAGNEEALRATVMSLLPQVDRLFVYLNHFRDVPAFLQRHAKITCHIDTDGRRYGDAGKFWGLEQSPDAVYVTCDDDIVYPSDFTTRLVEELAQSRGAAAVGVHGSLVLQPCPGYYRDGSRAVFHFERALMRRRRVHVVATNACAFHSSVVRMTMADFKAANMADIWLAQYLQREGLPAYVLPRPEKWLRPIEVQRPTIYEQSRSATGSAYDSSRRQDEVLATMYPVSLLDAPATRSQLAVQLVHVDGAQGVAEAIAAFAARERDALVVIVADADSAALRQAALRAAVTAEVHLVVPGAKHAGDYKPMLSGDQVQVQAWTLRDGTKLERAPAQAWSAWLDRVANAKVPA